jgi:hypothetical protein
MKLCYTSSYQLKVSREKIMMLITFVLKNIIKYEYSLTRMLIYFKTMIEIRLTMGTLVLFSEISQ